MSDERPCNECIFHDNTCTRWTCRPITRKTAEGMFDIVLDLLTKYADHDMVCVGDITKEMKDE